MPSSPHPKTFIFRRPYTLPIVLIILGGCIGLYFSLSPDEVSKKAPDSYATPVIAVPAALINSEAVVHGMGLVIPAVQISLKARVAGEVTEVADNFRPGGRIQQGKLVAQLDPADFQVALDKAMSEVEKSLADLQLEQGSQTIAREEVQMFSKKNDHEIEATDLMLRKPQLAQAQAALHGARSDLKMAQLNLERTTILSPFNAIIRERYVNIGAHVSSQDTIADLVGTDAYWVQASIPLDQVAALHHCASTVCQAKVISQNGQYIGQMLQLAGTLTDNTRLARVIIEVKDPLHLRDGAVAPGLILDDFVTVEISGKQLKNVVALSRDVVRDNNTVWIYDHDKLVIRAVIPVWRTKEFAYFQDDIKPGEMIIVSDLTAPVEGMELMLQNAPSSKDGLSPGAETADEVIND